MTTLHKLRVRSLHSPTVTTTERSAFNSDIKRWINIAAIVANLGNLFEDFGNFLGQL